MGEYTPTTGHVRAQYARQQNYDDYYNGELSREEFDRWLAQHDAEVVMAERERIVKVAIPQGFGSLAAIYEIIELIEGENNE